MPSFTLDFFKCKSARQQLPQKATFLGGQFGPDSGGHFTPDRGGQFKSDDGGQFRRIFHFDTAYHEISQMLDGTIPLDLQRAVFLSEWAFFDGSLDFDQYKKAIDRSAGFIQQALVQRGLDPADNQAINYMCHKYMSDTLVIEQTGLERSITSFPKSYDFEDPMGYEDPTKMFVSKLMFSNSGQCKSLPLLYLVLVERLGGDAYLSFSPSHTFIKVRANNGRMYNLELTNGRITSDQWVIGSGYIKAEALQSGLYLDTLNKKRIIANCMADLAQYYSWRFGGYDEFVLGAVNKSLEHDPTNVVALSVKSDYYTTLFQKTHKELGSPTKEDVAEMPKLDELLSKMYAMYDLMDNLGFEQMPDQAYMDWLNTLETKRQEQAHKESMINFSNF